MSFFGWFGKRKDREPLRRWHAAWNQVAAVPTREGARELRRRLEQLDVSGEDHEIEREMLDGLDELLDLSEALASEGPAPVATGHKAVGSDECYLTAPASLPDDPAQPFGTLLLTNARAIFVGGAKAMTIPWHRVGSCERRDRDLLLVRADGQDVHRLRCNTFADALRAAALANHLRERGRI
jgi:hypothetical protein